MAASSPSSVSDLRRSARWRWLLWAVALLALAFGVRVWNLDTQSLWHDEGWSVYSAYTPFAPMGVRGADVNAPFAYYATVGLMLRLAGDSLWAMRFTSVLYGLVTVAVAGRIAGQWYGARAGGLAMLLVALSPILWVFSQEIRAYVAMPLAALILLWLLDRLLAQRGAFTRREVLSLWLPLAAVELWALYAHNLSVPLVAWLNVTAVLTLVVARNWRRLGLWLLVQGAALVFYLPWLLTQRQTGGALNTPPALEPSLLWNIWQSYFTGLKAMLSADPLLTALLIGFGALTLATGVVALRRFPTQRTLLLVSQVLLLPVFQLAIILAARIDFHPRYFILGVPATLILVAAGTAGAGRISFPIRVLIVMRRTLAAALAAGLAIALFARMVWLLYSSPIYQHDDFRAIADHYARLGPDDAVIIPYGWEPSLDYYQEKRAIRARFVEIPLHSSPDMIAARLADGLQGVQRAEVLTWYQLPADMRGAFPCLLSAVGSVDGSLTVSGLRTDRYTLRADAADVLARAAADLRGDPHTAPVPLGALTWTGRTLAGAPAGQGAACLVTRWALPEPTGADWRLHLDVLHPDRYTPPSDSAVLDDRQLPTRLWPAGGKGSVFTLLSPLDIGPSQAPGLVLARAYVPENAEAGGAVSEALIGQLTVGAEGVTLNDYAADDLPRLDKAPDLLGEVTVGAAFPGVGMLVGAAFDPSAPADALPPLTLIWRADATPALSYTVFVHLVAPDGQIIAQSDALPVGGYRRTTTWRPGEYILDRHTFTLNLPGFTGSVTPMVGLYDTHSGGRVRLADGGDVAPLPMTLRIE